MPLASNITTVNETCSNLTLNNFICLETIKREKKLFNKKFNFMMMNHVDNNIECKWQPGLYKLNYTKSNSRVAEMWFCVGFTFVFCFLLLSSYHCILFYAH